MPTALALTKISLTSQPLHASASRQYRMEATINLGDPYAASGIEMLPAVVTAAAGVTCAAIKQILCASACDDGTHYFRWDVATNKMWAFVHATGAEAAAVDLSNALKNCACTVVFE